MSDDAAEVAAFVRDRVRAKVGTRWKQGEWQPSLATTTGRDSVDLVATTRLWRVPRVVAESIVAWSRGERDVDLLRVVPTPRDVLARQARGRRCVSILDDDADAKPHANALDFVLHDLCHLEKFVDPEHHVGQVGFFASAEAAMRTAAYLALESSFDAAFVDDVDHVVADMNGSAIFLFAALKMKLKMAVRRAHARDLDLPMPTAGVLSDDERARYLSAEEVLLDVLDITGDERRAASSVTTKRDTIDDAAMLLTFFEARGALVLSCR